MKLVKEVKKVKELKQRNKPDTFERERNCLKYSKLLGWKQKTQKQNGTKNFGNKTTSHNLNHTKNTWK